MRALHLVGSPTSGFFDDLSRLYAAAALEALSGTDEHLIAHVAPGGRWSFPSALDPAAVDAAPEVPTAVAAARIVELAPDVVVPQLFCPAGMTTYRALPELLGIPLVGNPSDVMAVGANKPHARAIVEAAGVAVAEGIVVRRHEIVDMDLPVVIKPAAADNSAGVTLVREPGDLTPALARAFDHGDEALVERYVELGHEVRCGVLERDGDLVCLPLERYAVDTERKPIRDEADKLRRGDTGGLELVAKTTDYASIVDPDDPITDAVWTAARACHRALGCHDYSLFDFRVDPTGVPVFLEASLYCSFAPTSVLAVMAAAAGIDVRDLFVSCVAQARARFGSVGRAPRG